MSTTLAELVAWRMEKRRAVPLRVWARRAGGVSLKAILLLPVVLVLTALLGDSGADSLAGWGADGTAGGEAGERSSMRYPRRLSASQLSGRTAIQRLHVDVTGPGINPRIREQVLDVFLDRAQIETGLRTVILPLPEMRMASARCTGVRHGPYWPGAPWRVRLEGAGYGVLMDLPWLTLAHLGTLGGWERPVHESILDAMRRERAERES